MPSQQTLLPPPSPTSEEAGSNTGRWDAAAINAVSILTRLPLPSHVHARIVRGARAYFSWVGAGLGLLVAGIVVILSHVFPAGLTAIMAVLLLVIFTGALHIDGLGDTADGMFLGGTPDRRLAVMHDSRMGTYGVIAIAGILALDAGALGSLHAAQYIPALVSAVLLGRWAMTGATLFGRAATSTGLGAMVIGREHWVRDGLIGTVPVLFLFVLNWRTTVYGIVIAGIVAWGLVWKATRNLSGINGDVLGAIVECVQCSVLILFTVHGIAQ